MFHRLATLLFVEEDDGGTRTSSTCLWDTRWMQHVPWKQW